MSGTSKLFADIDAQYADRVATMSDEAKMLVGLPYLANTSDLIHARAKARRLQSEYNKTGLTSALDAPSSSSTLAEGQNLMSDDRKRLLSQLLELPPSAVEKVEIEPPLYVDYGTNIKPEGAFYANYNTTILDCSEVRLGDGVLFGPNVSIYCGTHSVSVKERKEGLERSLPVSIGRDTWVGGGTIIMAGVTIGMGCTIGAGSVVTKDIADWSVAVGTPCRVLRTLSEDERA
ncbi:related to galactoside O-acetyltransferase [Ustilago bromivora]|uniref:Related to galactoside O-acetyltransferase n=1 Tax=Ustilago bromivora TaxID=307758 RepID=A0A1K0FW70_9BASI|nr:related to galactoside O-acetyltransferase [Ustilago bromivora]SYW75838.1 related to galactoside O-acetyltransferase [Ustilago bromivora]